MRFDGFEIVCPLAAGGMGEVYVARDQALNRLVAIKFVAPTDRDPLARERFATEAVVLAHLQHPNIVSLFRIGAVGDRPYTVCELIEGDRLDDLALPLPWTEVVRIGAGLARGVAASHDRGVLHRDIKPANVMVARDGLVKLLDFGLAIEAGAAQPGEGATSHRRARHTGVGNVVGTPRYMAPELWAGKSASCSSDVYALGLVLHELVAGGVPAERPAGLALVPAPLARLIERCLSRDPNARPESAAAVRDELEQLERLTRAQQPTFPLPSTVSDAARTLALRGQLGELATETLTVPGRLATGTPPMAACQWHGRCSASNRTTTIGVTPCATCPRASSSPSC
jgi:serine/threonine protein kinase